MIAIKRVNTLSTEAGGGGREAELTGEATS